MKQGVDGRTKKIDNLIEGVRKTIFPALISGSKIYFPTNLSIPTFFHKYVKKSRLFSSDMKISRNTGEGRKRKRRDWF